MKPTSTPTVKRSDLAQALFDTLSLYCVEQGFHDKVKELTPVKLKEVQKSIEKFLDDNQIEVVEE